MRYVDMALDLTEDQFDRLSSDQWFRDMLIAHIETSKIRVRQGRCDEWRENSADLAARLGWVIERDDAGWYALPRRAAELRRRVEQSERYAAGHLCTTDRSFAVSITTT
jgi:hypothetical protein